YGGGLAAPDRSENRMKKRREKNGDVLLEHDFSKGVRGKYARRYVRGVMLLSWIPTWPSFFHPRKLWTALCGAWAKSFVAGNLLPRNSAARVEKVREREGVLTSTRGAR